MVVSCFCYLLYYMDNPCACLFYTSQFLSRSNLILLLLVLCIFGILVLTSINFIINFSLYNLSSDFGSTFSDLEIESIEKVEGPFNIQSQNHFELDIFFL